MGSWFVLGVRVVGGLWVCGCVSSGGPLVREEVKVSRWCSVRGTQVLELHSGHLRYFRMMPRTSDRDFFS